jgi:metal-responsive CopG/Arc/MetJ family transcriptional regulator
MKTAISIPDDLFRGAERFAKRTKKSRSHLFSEALREYLARHSPDEITDALNLATTELDGTVDPFTSSAARRSLEKVDW